ncbi:MAG: ThiF family adenylyltransferase [Acidobacteria bacterium]|nr:ThiF family adenylyltransferase [Acidobacteriota bacterium]
MGAVENQQGRDSYHRRGRDWRQVLSHRYSNGFPGIHVVDYETAEFSNLNRQCLTIDDVLKKRPKAHAVIRNISPFSVSETTLFGYHMPANEFFKKHGNKWFTVALACVDSHAGNAEISEYGIKKKLPVVFVNVSRTGHACRVFVQRPEEACYLCCYPDAWEPRETKPGCTISPAISDILSVAAGLAVRAVVNEIHGKRYEFNCRDLTFTGFDIKRQVDRNPGCPLCGEKVALQDVEFLEQNILFA